MTVAPPRPALLQAIRRSLGLAFAVAMICGVGGAVFGTEVVEALGRLTHHDEFRLRLLGWCWSGLPWALGSIAFLVRRKVHETVKALLIYVLAVWCASAALLLPSRSGNLARRFGTAYPDARPLGFAWGCGLLPVVALVIVSIVGAVVVQKLIGGPLSKKALRSISWSLGGLWVLALTVGLVAALIGPLP